MSAKITADSLLVYKTLYWADGVLDHDDVLYFASRIFREYPLYRVMLQRALSFSIHR